MTDGLCWTCAGRVSVSERLSERRSPALRARVDVLALCGCWRARRRSGLLKGGYYELNRDASGEASQGARQGRLPTPRPPADAGVGSHSLIHSLIDAAEVLIKSVYM